MRHHTRDITADDICRLVGDAPIMFEIGAHEGSHTRMFLAAMPHATIYCFEPDSRPIERFLEALGTDQRVHLEQVAVAASDGVCDFWASTGPAGGREDWDFSGSIRRPTGHREHSPEIDFCPPRRVQCIRLDTWARQHHVSRPDFAWIDVQGAQRDVIAGGRRILDATRYICIECHKRPLYDGETTEAELCELLSAHRLVATYTDDNLLFEKMG